MANYSYNKLDPEHRQFRLCTLSQGSLDDPLSCTLDTVSLNHPPDYGTLSYVWGDPTFNKEINIDGSILSITTSLYTALRYLRKIDQPRIIWADGICINQADIDERSFQVTLMGDIYMRARELQIWLGEVKSFVAESSRSGAALKPNTISREQLNLLKGHHVLEGDAFRKMSLAAAADTGSEYSERPDKVVRGALSILDLLVNNNHFHQMPFYEIASDCGITIAETWYQSLTSLSLMLSHALWKRIWIVQEVVLSSHCTVHIGTHTLPILRFWNAAQSFRTHFFGCCRDPWATLWTGGNENAERLCKALTPLQYLFQMDHSLYQNKALNIAWLYNLSSSHEATDLRDHVYAISGLIRPQQLINNLPDYRLTVSEVYERATRAAYAGDRSLFMLRYAVGVASSDVGKLASWACDWSETKMAAPLAEFDDKNRLAQRYVAREAGSDRLVIEAISVALVTDVTYDLDKARGHDLARKLLDLLRHKANRAGTADTDDFIKRLFMDDFNGEEINANVMRDMRAWWDCVTAGIAQSDMRPVLIDLNREFVAKTRQAACFFTNEGSMGLGRSDLCVGDVIVVVKGSPMPLCLRQLKTSSEARDSASDNQKDYRFVGACYLPGAIKDEVAISTTKWQEMHLC